MYTLDTKIKFGKHKLFTIQEVIDDDPTYIEWCLDNVKGFELDDAAMDYFNDAIDRYYQYDDIGFCYQDDQY
jgi:hypothetical protein